MLSALAAPLCAAALMPAAASAVFTGGIEGTITDAVSHDGIAGVEVCATRFEPVFIKSCEYTAADGTYAIESLPAGEYEVWFYARRVGYFTAPRQGLVAVGNEAVTGVDAELVPFSRIAGTVTQSSDGQPVEGVEVCAYPVSGAGFADCAYTEPDGSYTLEELEAGEYGVEFQPYESGQNLVGEFYDGHANWNEADPVVLGAGDTASGIDAALDPGATISGHVSSAVTGAALEKIPVCAVEAATGELWICAATEAGGAYTLDRLRGGDYKVVFSIDFEEWFGEEFEEEDDGFPTRFWNNQTTLAAANVISLATGGSVSAIDAHLGTAPAGQPPATIATPPAVTPPGTALSAPPPRHKQCRKGLKRKKVKGRMRCVRSKKRRHHGSKHPLIRVVP